MKKSEATESAGSILGIPMMFGAVLLVLLLLAGALMVQSERLPVQNVPAWTLAALGICGFSVALFAAVRASRGKFLWGIAAGAVFLALLLAASFIWFGQPVDFARVALVAGITLCTALLGSLTGAGRRQRKRKK